MRSARARFTVPSLARVRLRISAEVIPSGHFFNNRKIARAHSWRSCRSPITACTLPKGRLLGKCRIGSSLEGEVQTSVLRTDEVACSIERRCLGTCVGLRATPCLIFPPQDDPVGILDEFSAGDAAFAVVPTPSRGSRDSHSATRSTGGRATRDRPEGAPRGGAAPGAALGRGDLL